MNDIIFLREIAELTHCCEDAVSAWLKHYPDAPRSLGLTKSPKNRLAIAYPRAPMMDFLRRHGKIPPLAEQGAAPDPTDLHLSLYELADRFNMPFTRFKKLHYERGDSPPALYKRKDPSKITLKESAKLLKISDKRIHELFLRDPSFPKKTGGKRFRKGIGHFEFDHEEMLRYQRLRKKSRGKEQHINVTPIQLSGSLRNNVVQFLSMPSGRRQRVTPSGTAQTVKIRTEGVVGAW